MKVTGTEVVNRLEAAESFAEEARGGIPQRELTDEEIQNLTDVVMNFSQQMCGVELHPYQIEFGWRIVYSLLSEDSSEVTALFSRQSGKTECVAVVTCGCAVILPILAKYFSADPRLAKFSRGLWAGIYAPGYEQSGIMWARMKLRMYSKAAKQTLLDPDIDIDLTSRNVAENMTLPNGSFVDCGTAAPQAKIEGKTYHLILLEECLGPDSLVETQEGFRRIEDVVNSGYSGRVRAWDHTREETCWAEVEGLLKRPAINPCYEIEFKDGTKHQCTGEHPWFIDGIGYVSSFDLYNAVDSLYNEGAQVKRDVIRDNSGLHVRVNALQSCRPEGRDMLHLQKSFQSKENQIETPLLFLRVQEGKIEAIRPTSIRRIPPLKEVFDLKTSKRNFFASGILSHNTQDIESHVIRSSIHPMGAAVAGTIVKIGTCNQKKSEFYEACRRNRRADVNQGLIRSRKRTHFEYDYTVAQKYNDRYRKFVEKEKERLGENSDDFRMKYRLHWLLERGMFVNSDQFGECGIKEPSSLEIWRGRGSRAHKIKFTRPATLVTFDNTGKNLVASIDVGRQNSTIITIGKVFWDNPIRYGEEDRYHMHVYNWLELSGDNHEAQHPQILSFLRNYTLSEVIIDATGKGDPVYSRIAADLEGFGIKVTPFIFSSQSKDVGYKVLAQEIATKRLTYPAGAQATKTTKWQRFHQQMCDLEKEWRGQMMVVHKDLKDKEARDDFPDSLMMLCWLVNVRGTMEMEEAPNPFIGRAARWAASDMLRDAGAWFKTTMNPRQKTTRPSKSGRWDA